MKILNDYCKLQEEIYKYFGYVEDWVAYPIDDRTDYYWNLELENHGNPEDEGFYQSGDVFYAESKKFAEDRDGDEKDGYSNEIYHQRFLPKAVYEGKDYTMIVVDTHTDGNKFLAIYDNKKRV